MTDIGKIKKFITKKHSINCALTDEIIEFIEKVESESKMAVAKPLLGDGWRDARKELPPDGQLLLYVDVDGWRGVVISTIAKSVCACYFDKDIIAWMPLPDPPSFA